MSAAAIANGGGVAAGSAVAVLQSIGECGAGLHLHGREHRLVSWACSRAKAALELLTGLNCIKLWVLAVQEESLAGCAQCSVPQQAASMLLGLHTSFCLCRSCRFLSWYQDLADSCPELSWCSKRCLAVQMEETSKQQTLKDKNPSDKCMKKVAWVTNMRMRNAREARQVPDLRALPCPMAGAGKPPQTSCLASPFKSVLFS